MTDDDFVNPGAVQGVLEQLGDDLDLLLINSEVATRDMKTTLVMSRLRIACGRDFSSCEADELLAVAGDLLTYIGTVVMRRSTWLDRDILPYLGTEFVHVGVIFQKPLLRSARIIAEPLIRIRHGNAQWSARAFDIWMFRWPRLIWSFPHLSKESKAKVVAREPYRSLVTLCAMKGRGCFGKQEYASLSGLRLGWWRRAAAFALASFPDIPFNALARLLFFLLGDRRRLDPRILEDLRVSPYSFRLGWFGRTDP